MPSKTILEAKKAETAALASKIKESVAGVVVSYSGMTVDVDTKLRTDLRRAGVEYKVYKNTTTERAAADAGYPAMKEYFVGMTAIAISPKDPVIAAKILKAHADKVEKFEIKCGYVDGKMIDAAGVKELADIPSKEALIGRILGSVMGPLYSFAYALQAIVDKENAPAAAAAE